jgi:hypothetical protein
MLGQDGADEPNDVRPVGQDPDDVGAAPDLLVEPLGLFDQIWRQIYFGNAVKAVMSAWSTSASARRTASPTRP